MQGSTLSAEKICSPEESPELNILILGETGVGKSTWINAFQNYLVYSSFEEAESSKLLSIIPSCFTLTNANWETIKVQTGSDENENFRDGQSSTQGARIHKLKINNTTIRLIDTPGVGDVRGIEQDQVNMKNILDTIGNLKVLHGICILLKSNVSRLTTQFRFCVKELLTNLSKGASKNIAFCFTYARGTQFRPADAIAALNVLLQENDLANLDLQKKVDAIYCFDNEAMRYLALVKNNPPFEYSEPERNEFKRSWDHSAAETKRLLQHFHRLSPHPVRDTISLHNARNVVLKLTKPIAEVTRKIEKNRLQVEEERKRIESSEANLSKLSSHVKVRRLAIKSMKFDFPKLGCYHMECRTKSSTKKTRYGICHERYFVKGVRADVFGRRVGKRPEWENWPGFNMNGICGFCSHKFVHHSNIFYDAKEIEKIQEDQELKKVLARNSNGYQAKREMVSAKTKLLKEFENELKQICEASARFAHFTRVNSITPYNDGMEDYLKLSIEEEKANSGIGSENYKVLVARLEQYRKEKEILEKAMENAGTGTKADELLTPDEIHTTVENLKGLKHSGLDLVEALDCIIETERMVDESMTIEQGQEIKYSDSDSDSNIIKGLESMPTMALEPKPGKLPTGGTGYEEKVRNRNPSRKPSKRVNRFIAERCQIYEETK